MGKIEDWIKFCRYYKGEEINPFKDGNKAAFWDFERYWVVQTIKSDGEENKNLSEYINDYIRNGLGDFEKFDDTPMALKAIIFNRFAQGFQSMDAAKEPFKDFYKREYYK